MKKLILFGALTLILFSWSANAGNAPDNGVLKAFELRMNGKVDEARIQLDEILKKDSTNAMAHYEMARLKHYLLTAGTGVKIEDILTSINKAVKYDPQNVTYSYYKGVISFLNAFSAMQTGGTEVKVRIEETCAQFKKVLAMKPDFQEASLYLVDIYGVLPKEMGGDSMKAVEYANKLSASNTYIGAKAKAVLAAKDTDFVKFWMERLSKDKQNTDLLVEVGIAYLKSNDLKNAEKYFDDARKLDPSKNVGILNLARFHMMMVMQDRDKAAIELPIAKSYLEKYISSVPTPIVPLKAYALGLLMRTEMFMGNKAEADKILEDAKKLDKYFSRAMGIPTLILFDSPDQRSHQYFSFFSPF